MKNEIALSAATAIHETINGSDAFFGYEGTTEAFETLLAEVDTVVDYLIQPLDGRNVDAIVETWFEVQNEIAEGNLEVDWYLNPEAALDALAAA
jgi:hypothetical protein